LVTSVAVVSQVVLLNEFPAAVPTTVTRLKDGAKLKFASEMLAASVASTGLPCV
jgi:hypothetical protein